MPTPTNNRAESRYFAQPYSLDATGFYFQSLEEYETKANACRDSFDQPVEEFELQFIDGDNHELFAALAVTQATLGDWFDTFADIDAADQSYTILVWLLEQGMAVDDAMSRCDEFYLYNGTAADYACEYVDECMELSDFASRYLDYQMLGRDLLIEGHIHELDHNTLVVGWL
jgi:hypothetical protein